MPPSPSPNNDQFLRSTHTHTHPPPPFQNPPPLPPPFQNPPPPPPPPHILLPQPHPPLHLRRRRPGSDHTEGGGDRVRHCHGRPAGGLAGPALRPRLRASCSGSGKTLAYLLLAFSLINFQRSAVQALIVVPTRELGIQVTKVARKLAAKPTGFEKVPNSCTIMALLDGGMLKRHKSWLKAEPPEIIVATIASLSQMLEKHAFKLEAVRVLVIDEVDFMFNSPKQVYALRKLLTSYSAIDSRQTVFASASIPQHNRFLYDCVQQKWTKSDVIHVHVSPVEPMPSHIYHKFVICNRKQKLDILLALLQRDVPKSGIIFVGEQSEKSKKAGQPPSATLVIEYLKDSYEGCLEILLLEEDMNFNARTTSLSEVRQGGCILVATDLAGRGVDLPQTTHIYNFDLPRSAIDYLHRSGRTGRLPFSKEGCSVTSLIVREERFVLQRFENELMFQCEQLLVDSPAHV